MNESDGRGEAARAFTAASTKAPKVKARDITSIADKIEKGGRFDLMQFYLGESDSSDIGLDLTNIDQMSNWKGSAEKRPKKLICPSRTQRIAEKIEKREDERSDLLKFYLGETDLPDIGIDLEDLEELSQWKTATKGAARPKRRSSNEIAEDIMRHEDDRMDNIRCYAGEMTLLELGIKEADVESFLSKFIDGPAKVNEARARFAVDVVVDDNGGEVATKNGAENIDGGVLAAGVERVIVDEVPLLIGPDLSKHIMNPQA